MPYTSNLFLRVEPTMPVAIAAAARSQGIGGSESIRRAIIQALGSGSFSIGHRKPRRMSRTRSRITRRPLRAAVTQAENARAAPPTWAADLERVGFDPNAVSRSLFGGSGALGAKPGAANEARAAKAFLGDASPEWAGLRQAAVQRLTAPNVSGAKTVERLRDFTDGTGKGVAGELFSSEELGNLRRFAAALHSTLRPEAAGKEMSGAAAKALAKAVDLVAGMVAFKVGGLPAAAGTYGAKVGQRALIGGVGAAQARRSFEGGAPRLLTPPPTLPLGQLATGEALGYGQQ